MLAYGLSSADTCSFYHHCRHPGPDHQFSSEPLQSPSDSPFLPRPPLVCTSNHESQLNLPTWKPDLVQPLHKASSGCPSLLALGRHCQRPSHSQACPPLTPAVLLPPSTPASLVFLQFHNTGLGLLLPRPSGLLFLLPHLHVAVTSSRKPARATPT